MLGLFESSGGGGGVREPLAARMRPRTLDEFVGQEQIVGPGRALRRAIESDQLPSMILWGPPGTGKTTLARVIAQSTGANFQALSAVSAGVADLRRVVADAAKLKRAGKRTVLFIDEIHRFNKAQQDAVLPYVEDGTVTLIGATTENPSFEVNSALLSRSRVFVLQSLGDDDIRTLVERALADAERGLGGERVRIEPDALDALGEPRQRRRARRAQHARIRGRRGAARRRRRPRSIDRQTIADALQQRARNYDKDGDGHYDTISAFIKTMRGSDPDAAVYYLARMIESGEDPLFIARRLVIFASEDVGLADPQALPLAIAAQQSVHFVGMPEGFYPLAHATLYLATAPKSNTVGRAYGAALADVESTRNDPVPLHLRNAPTRLMKHLGYGSGYRYAHDDYARWMRGRRAAGGRLQPNLPDALRAAPTSSRPARRRSAAARLDRARRGSPNEDPFRNAHLSRQRRDDRRARRKSIEAMVPLLAGGYNPSSVHAQGRAARGRARRARAPTSRACSAPRRARSSSPAAAPRPTSSRSSARPKRARPTASTSITVAFEHHAVLHAFDVLEAEGWSVTRLPVSASGLVDPRSRRGRAAPRHDAGVDHARQQRNRHDPAAGGDRRARPCAPARSFTPTRSRRPATSSSTSRGSASTCSRSRPTSSTAPRASACCSCGGARRSSPQIVGGGQEHGLRSGTENLAGIAGLARALVLADAERAETVARVAALRDRLAAGIAAARSGHARSWAPAAPRLPHILSLGFPDLPSDALLMALDLEGVSASAGSACAAGSLEPSHVVAALGVAPEYATGVLRFSLGRTTTVADVDRRGGGRGPSRRADAARPTCRNRRSVGTCAAWL